jgi:hypothetical protein
MYAWQLLGGTLQEEAQKRETQKGEGEEQEAEKV